MINNMFFQCFIMGANIEKKHIFVKCATAGVGINKCKYMKLIGKMLTIVGVAALLSNVEATAQDKDFKYLVDEFADLKINNCLDKTNIYCAAGILIFYTLGYHKIGHSFRCMNGFWSILLYQRQVPFLCNALNHMFCQDLYMSTL